MIYIDFDDVILNTSEVLGRKYYNDNILIDYVKDADFVINYNFNNLLKESSIINNSIEIIKKLNYKKVSILTKILSLDNEGIAKVRYLRSNGVKCNVILVPEHIKKTDVVDPVGNILVDDLVHNLDDWKKAGGKGILFDRFGTNIDTSGKQNTKYESIKSLDELNKY